ncbi:hypothetical protein KUTeg_021270 [Tegillarca granosa]|uniref:RING-type domain-containing protein n=1 Tax=Tegillarca granosa TaxID=220873 RepID=A0ABQ9E7Q5_TEGGR|nr:hypothetical protein KUTeg_020388 [Tegillarca granosa]KAJ8302283.1 hypothetical protein KUTeg_021270 [Tegillarca granosa]
MENPRYSKSKLLCSLPELIKMTDVTETFEEQFFTCSICTDVFQEPKLLPCQHSFCKKCIQPYIKSAVISENNKTGFLCPYCRCFVEAENPESPAETWVDRLPTNFNLVCMIEAFDGKRSQSNHLR